MRKITAALVGILSLLAVAPAFAQSAPATLPYHSVYGRIGAGPGDGGPGQAIPFTTLAPYLLGSICPPPQILTIASGVVQCVSSPGTNGLIINGDIVLTHPLTPNAVNNAHTIITLGNGAGGSLAPISTTQYLTLLGFSAGGSITTADHITAVGAFALASFTNPVDTANTAIGIDTLRVLTAGAGNTAVGEHAISSATTSNNGTAVGAQSQIFSGGGTNNSSFGAGSLQSNASFPLNGNENTGLGAQALLNIRTTSAGNTSGGFQSLFSTTVANFNSAFGYRAGSANTTGSYNVFLGAAGITNPTTGNDNILIGTTNHIADTVAAGTNNQLNIGGLIYGNLASGGVGIGVSADPGPGALITKKQAFATLTACSSTIEGAIVPVTDSSTATWGATITGGSTNHVLAYCNGTNWTVAAK